MNKRTMNIVNYALLRAIALCKGKGDIRDYINGIFVEPSLGRATATNGHRLFRAYCFDVDPKIKPFTFDAELPVSHDGKETLEIDDDRVEVVTTKKTTVGRLIEGKYPDVDKVLESNSMGTPSQKVKSVSLNALYLSDVQKALGAPGVTLSCSGRDGDGAIVVTFIKPTVHVPEDAVFVVMPTRP